MVRTRRQNSPLGVEHDEHSAQEPTPRALNPAHPIQIRFTDPSASGETSRQEPFIGLRNAADGEQIQRARAHRASPTRSTRSQRSNASTAARIKTVEYEAAERLSAIKIHQLQLEADLVQKKLEADIANLQDDDQGGTRGPEEVINANEQMDDWLRHADHSHRDPTYDSLPARATGTLHVATPAVRPVTNFTEPRSERRYEDHRTRSPTPNRSRSRSIEALVASFERMSHYRPPPRSSTELPTFDGSENEWMPFKASMRDSTRLHKFSRIENIQRLRNALKGEARDAVASLLYTACDPTEIMEALEQSFGRPEALIDRALDEIKQLPRLGSTTTELNVFAVKVRNIVATITNVEGLDGCLQNRMLTRDIVDKLPPDLRRSFARYASENRRAGEPHIVTLSRFLNIEATIGLEFTYSKPTPSTKTNQKEPHPRSTKAASQSPWKIRNANVFTANDDKQCMCCGGDHELQQCHRMQEMTVNARWEWAKAYKICFKCLKNKHQRTECKAKQCGIDGCTHSHHPLLHERNPVSEVSRQNSNASQEPPEVVASTSSSKKTGNNVMLKVCPIVVTNSNGDEVHTYALLDEGSTISLIEEDLAEQLNLKGPVNTLNMRGINSTEKEETSRTVRLRLRGKNTRSSHIIRARTVKRFHLLHQSISQELMRYEHLQGLDPNEVCYERARPRLLIGSDHWELIVSKELLTGDRYEPAASRTELGWVIHGTAPQAAISHENDEHVFHLRAENCTQSELDANAIGVSVEPPFCAMMQKEDKKGKTNQMKETVQLHLPRNIYTRGVRSKEHPFDEVRGQANASKIHIQTSTTTVEQDKNEPLNGESTSHKFSANELVVIKVNRRSPSLKLWHTAAQEEYDRSTMPNTWPTDTCGNPSYSDPYEPLYCRSDTCEPSNRYWDPWEPPELHSSLCEPFKCIGRTALVKTGKPTSTQRKVQDFVHFEPRTRGGVFHRTIKKLAVLTRNMKLRESFAEGRMLRTGA